MLLGNANVKSAVRMRGGEFIDSGAARHRGGNRADSGVGVGQLRQRFAKDILVSGRPAAGALVLLAGNDVELDHAMIFVVGGLGRRIAFALFGNDMDQHRPFGIVADIFEDGDQLVEIMPVNRADIIEAQFLEQGAAHRHAAGIFLGALGRVMHPARQLRGQLAGKLAQAHIFAR